MRFPAIATTTLACLLAWTASAETIRILNRDINIEPIGDYCPIDRANPDEDFLAETMEDVQRGINQLLAYWISCPALQRFRSGEIDRAEPYVLILANYSNEGLVAVDMPRDEYLPMAERQFLGEQGAALLKSATEDAGQRIDDKLRELGELAGTEISLPGAPELSLVGRDDLAVYLAIKAVIQESADETIIVGITAMTTLNGLPVSVNVYDEYADPSTYDRLHADARLIADHLIKTNVEFTRTWSLPAFSQGWYWMGIDWAHVLQIGIIGGLIGGAFGALRWLWRRFAAGR